MEESSQMLDSTGPCGVKPHGLAVRDPTETVIVLSISPLEEDHLLLKRILSRSEPSIYAMPKWELHPISTLESAVAVLRKDRAAIVLTEHELSPGVWTDVLAEVSTLSAPPLLIVTSRFADEHLWAEALNLGAYDVLAKPFDSEEVIRVLTSAWLHEKIQPLVRTIETVA
jgi:DNA-binding NtrC family response regulator